MQESGVCYQTPNVAAVGVPDYIFGPEGIIKKMKTNGEWVYDEQMVAILGLEVQAFVASLGKTSKAMTSAVLVHLKT